MVKGVIAEVAVFPVSVKAVCSKVHHSNGELCSSYTQTRNLKEYDRKQLNLSSETNALYVG